MTYTRIRNPGIAERLRKDISCFESYGFTLERRDIICSAHSGNSGNNNNDPYDIFHSIDDPVTPTASLYIQVSGIALMASIGPYLRTLVRLSVDPINPRSLQAIVVIDDEGDKKKKKNNVDDDDGSRSIAHAIHMLIRNSMGAALFLNLHVVLPPGTSRGKVLKRMKQNENGCYEYPSVIVHEHDSNSSTIKRNYRYTLMGSKEPFIIDLGLIQTSVGVPPSIKEPLSQDCLKRFDPIRNYLSLNITTRMCTVRLTPLLYHLSQRLIGNVARIALSKEEETTLSKTEQQQRQQHPMIIVCLEKISNLYRVLMLARDYGIDIGTIGGQLVVVCKLNSTERFRLEAINFVSKNFTSLVGEDDGTTSNAAKQRKKSSHTIEAGEGKESPSSPSSPLSCFPLVVSIEKARELILKEVSSSSFPNVVGFDLHKDAKTLNEHSSDAKGLLSSAGAVILGYESDGIPPRIDQVVSQYVQIQSRTSVNVVAAFSIVLHAIMVQ